MRPVAFDLCCGSGGWASGLMAAGWRVIGYDIDPQPLYPGEFHQRDVKTIQPEELNGGTLIVASPPCEQFSRHGMPWTRKRNPPPPDTSIVEHVRWLAKETGIPLVMENVKFAQAFIGPAKTHVGPYYLWGNIPSHPPSIGKFKKKESYGSKDRLDRARIPDVVGRWIGEAFMPRECFKCQCVFDSRCGMFGCPNCHGEGI